MTQSKIMGEVDSLLKIKIDFREMLLDWTIRCKPTPLRNKVFDRVLEERTELINQIKGPCPVDE